MSTDLKYKINEWFDGPGNEKEFVRCGQADAFSVVGPDSMERDLAYVYSTKSSCVLPAKRKHIEFDSIGLICQRGLPNAKDVKWIRNLLGQHKLFFLGDMDPVDLMIFAWLRECLGLEQVMYLGISDGYLKRLGVELAEGFIIPCDLSELRSLSILDSICPDYRTLVGPACAGLLNDGRKIELEAVVTTLGPPGPLLTPVLK